MLAYPQIGPGAMGQYPIRTRRYRRTLVNAGADGSSIRVADPAGDVTEWELAYAGLSADEAAALEGFFESAEGSLNGFTFLDPTANLLARSDHLDHGDWSRGPLLALQGGGTDPQGGSAAWHVANPSGGAQSITQTLAAPGGYAYCLSVYVRAAQPMTITMLHGTNRCERVVATGWGRITASGSGDAAAETVTFGLELPPGGALDVFGMQVEPQAGASVYQSSTGGGVYGDARLRDDELTITATGFGRHSATVNIIHGRTL